MHEVETPQGVIEFPDEMQPDEITAALNQQFPSPQKLAAFSLAQGIGIPATVMGTLAAGAEGSQMTRDMAAARERRGLIEPGAAPISPATPEQLVGGLQAARGAAGEFMGSMSEVASDFLRRTGIDPSAMPGRNVLDITRQGLVPGGQPGVAPEIPIGISPLELLPEGRELKAGLQAGAGKFVSGFTEPGQALMLPFAGAKPVQAFFGAEALAEVPESIRALYQAKTLPEAGEAAFGAGANIAMGGLIGRHLLTAKGMPYARSVEEAAKVYGDMRSRAEQGAREVSAAEGGARVQPQAEAVAEAAQVPLKVLDADELLHPVEASLLQNVGARAGLRGEVRVVENFGERDPGHNMPFEADLAQTNPDGSFKAPGEVRISRDAFRKWIEGRTTETLPQQVAGALSEEIAHSFTTKKEAADYLNTLTSFERRTRLKAYLGEHDPSTLPGGFPDWKAGAEVLRQHVQELMRLTPNEFVERAKTRTGQWTKDGLYVIAKIVKRMREFIGTQAAEAGQKISYTILDRMERNVNAAAESIGEEAPFMLRREEGAEAQEKALDDKAKQDLITGRIKSGELKPENVTLTISPPMQYGTAKIPGFVQVDEFHPTEGNTFSSNPTQLKALGFEVPSEAELYKLGARQLKLPEAERLLGKEPSAAMLRRDEAKDREQKFKTTLGTAQRGLPEQAMLRVQRANIGGVLNNLVENVGDLTHRMTEDFTSGGYETVSNKVKKALRSLLDRYGFAKEHEENIRANAEGLGMPENEFRTRLDSALNDYAAEHSKLPVYNYPQRLARDAAVALGRKDWIGAVNRLEKLKELLDSGRENWIRETQRDDTAAAMLRRGEKEEELPGMAATKGKGVLTKPETVPAGERALTEMQKEPATPAAVDRSSYQHLSQVAEVAATDPKAKPISFTDYAEAMRVKFGPMSTPALVESFERNLWPTLMNASGEKLAALRDKLNLRSKVGSRAVSDPSRERGGFRLEAQVMDPKLAKEGRKRRLAADKYRSNVISSIATKLLGEAVSQAESPERTEVSPYDLWKQRDRRTGKIKQAAPVQPIYNELSRQDQESPAILQKVLTDDSRQMGQTVSSTKRLTVLQNRETGKVELVSTFRDPRRGAVLLDPQSPGKTHAPLESILKRYRPIASVLLDDPVKGFRQSYESLGDYENRFGMDAKRAGQPSFAELPAAAVGEEEVPGSWEVNAPITNAEARAVMDHITGEVGRFDTPDDVRASLDSLREDSNRQALSAYRKLFAALEQKNPTASVEELLNQLAQNIYENHKAATSYEDFVTRTMAQGRPEVSEAVRGQPLAPDVPKGVESVIPKISVEPRVVPGGRPGAYIPKEEPSRMLSPEEQAYVRRRAGLPPETGDAQMLTRRDVRDKSEAAFFTMLGQVRSMFTRHGTKQDIATIRAASSTLPINMSQEAKRAIEQPSSSKKNKDGDLKVLAAARAINAGYIAGLPDQGRLADFHQMTLDAQAKASALLRQPTDLTLAALGLGDMKGFSRAQLMSAARQWLHSAEDLQKEVEYAQAHYGEPGLMNTTKRLRDELSAQLRWERAHGRTTKEAENYLPGLYKGEIYGDNSITFQSQILGKSFGKPKTFANQYEAISAGPFIPKLNNVAEIAAHRIRSGLNAILTDEAFHAPLNITDPATGTPVAIEAELSPKGGYQVPKGMEQYKLVYPLSGGPPLAVRRSYAPLMEDLFGKSGLQETPAGRALMQFGAIEKHTTLALDFYHLFKMAYFGGALMWHRAGWKGGYAALEFRPQNMAEAVRRGVITPQAMKWALGTEEVNVGGQRQAMTRQEISQMMQRRGLNVGRVQDAMYKHFVDELDVMIGGQRLGIGRYTRFLFDKFTRGIMNQAAVESFIRHNNDLGVYRRGPGGQLIKTPEPAEQIVKRVVADINTIFGSAGKQALIKNPTLRDIGQLLLLAPQWTGTRISMESKFLSRLATTPYVAVRYGLPEARLHAGPIGRAVGSGLVTMFALTQIINLMGPRHQLTFQNPEEGHKLDAWVPDPGGGPGHWVSPLSVFMELTHDVARMMQVNREDFMPTLMKIAGNKLHPVTRGVGSFLTGYTPTGQKITTFGGRLKALGTGMLPTPITLSALSRYAGHKVTDRISPNQPGALMRQGLSTFGIKSEVEERAATQIQKLADDYMKRNDLKPPTGWQQIQTDEPNYSKLRSAIRSGDMREARNLIDVLSKSHPGTAGKKDPVVHAMELYAKHNFTSAQDENDFYATLSTGQKNIYERAKAERERELQQFYDLYDSMPSR